MRPDESAARRSRHRAVGRAMPVVLLAVVLGAGVALRLRAASGLWLDEAQSVAIARVPLSQLSEALRHDGSPPLYYLMLHGWIELFGTGATAVRSLSVVLGIACIPAGFLAGRAVGGRRVGATTSAFVAASPFAIRYSTEVRMYSLLLLLALLGVWAFAAAERRPSLPRLAGLAVVSGLLMLTHYWTFFLLAAVGVVLVVRMVLGRRRSNALRELAAVALGGVLLVPWLPSMLFQVRHTGTPWAGAPSWGTTLSAMRSWGTLDHGTDAAEVIYLLSLVLCLLALFARRRADTTGTSSVLLLGKPWDARASTLFVAAVGGIFAGVAVSRIAGSGFAVRYTAAVMAPWLVLLAIGASRLPTRIAASVVGAIVLLGLATSADAPFTTTRTQAVETAAALRADLGPGDTVLYCPDQLAPSLSRLLPASIRQFVYPTLGPPDRVDWVDYAQRNAQGKPIATASTVSRRTSGDVWLVMGTGYRTFGQQCSQLDDALAADRCGREIRQPADPRYFEHEYLIRYRSCTDASGTPQGP